MTDIAVTELPAFPKRAANPFLPAPPYPLLRSDEPISRVRMPSGEVIWLVTSHEYVRQILTDPRVTADRAADGYPIQLGFPNRQMMRETARRTPAFIGMDAAEHGRRRRMIGPSFATRHTRELRPRVQEIVDHWVGVVEAGPRPVDLVANLATPVPTQVICEIMGVPFEDLDFIHARTRTISGRGGTADEKRAAMLDLNEYLEELIVRNEENPGDELIGQTITKFREAGMYTRQEMIGTVLVLLHGGKNGAANTISLGVVALLENPDQLAELKRDPSLMPGAVEEMLRYFSPSAEGACYRAVLEDIEIGGVVLRKGDGLLALGSTASRDGAVFENPDEFDIHRENAQNHLAFGYGIHQCIGQHVARLELEIVFNTLFRRLPDLRLAVPVEELNFMHDYSTYGIWEVPVTW